MQKGQPKILILTPWEEISLKLTRALQKRGWRVHTPYEENKEESSLPPDDYDLVVSFYKSRHQDRSYRVLFISHHRGSKQLIQVARDGVYDFSNCHWDANVEQVLSFAAKIVQSFPGAKSTSQEPGKVWDQGEEALANHWHE